MRGMGRGWVSSSTRSASLASRDFGRSVLSFLLHVWNHYDYPFDLSEVADWADQHQIAYRGPSGAIEARAQKIENQAEQAERSARVQIAKQLLAQEMDLSVIASVIGLGIDEVTRLAGE